MGSFTFCHINVLSDCLAVYFPECLPDYVYECVRAVPECVCASVWVYARVSEYISASWLTSLFLYDRLDWPIRFSVLCQNVWKVYNLLSLKSHVYIFSKHSRAAILELQNGDYSLLTFCNISASKHHSFLILVSKHTFSRQGI